MVVPYIPASKTLPEITIKGVILGVFLSVVLGAANTYLGLRVGLTVSASIPAAVISMGVLTLLAKVFSTKHNILENNAVQTAASAGESLAAGVLFTIPALLILNYWSAVSYWETTLVALAGGILGVLFTVPLRRALIVETELRFPEGVATAEVLKAGEPRSADDPDEEPAVRRARKSAGAGALAVGGLVGLLYAFLQGGVKLWHGSAEYARRFGDRTVSAFGADLSPALLGVGYIIGIRIAVLVFLGGVLGWVVGMPIYSALEPDTVIDTGQSVEVIEKMVADGDLPEAALVPQDDGSIHIDHTELGALEAAFFLWSNRIRYIGVGAMLVGGLWALVKLRGALGTALLQGFQKGRQAEESVLHGYEEPEVPRTEREFGLRATFFGVLGMVVPITALYWYATGSFGVAMVMAVLMVVTGFFFSAVGAYMAGLVGSSNNPISGVTILTVLAAAVTLRAMGIDSDLGPAATIFVAAIIACAGAIASDNMQDLKAGNLLGATPKRQQTMQIIGVSAAAFAVAPVLQLLHDAYTLGSADMPAPQAGLMAAVGRFVFEGGLPMVMVAAGAALAVLLILLDEFLEKTGSSFRTPVMPVAVGIYLPVGLSAPIFLGGLVAALTGRAYRRESPGQWWDAVTEHGNRAGVLFSSGLIAGEALIGIALAGLIASGAAGAIAVTTPDWTWPALLMFTYLVVLTWYMARRPSMMARQE